MRIGRSGQKALFATRSHESCCAVRHATVSCPSRLINTLQSRGACPQLPVALLLTALSCPDRVGKLVIVTLHGRTTQLQSGPRDCLPSDGAAKPTFNSEQWWGVPVYCATAAARCGAGLLPEPPNCLLPLVQVVLPRALLLHTPSPPPPPPGFPYLAPLQTSARDPPLLHCTALGSQLPRRS